MTIVSARWPRLMHPDDASVYVGGKANLSYLIEAHRLKPVRQHKSNTVYDRHDIDAAVDRLKLQNEEESKKPKPKKKPNES